MLKDTISVAGVVETNRFMKYIKKLYPNETPDNYEQEFETAVVFPYCLTPMHFFAYLNHTSYLKKSLGAGSTLSNSSFNENPLSLAARQNFKDSVSIIIKHIAKNYDLEKNPYLLRVINNNSIINLNSIEIPNLTKLYDLFVRQSTSAKLPKIISSSHNLPIYISSDEVTPIAKEFSIGNIDDNRGKEVTFYETLVKLNLTIGCTDSNDFLQSLMSTPNKEILTSKYVQIILEYKWKTLKKYMLTQGLLYVIYLTLLLCHLVWFIDGTGFLSSEAFLIFPFVVNILLLSVEIFQVYADFKAYFTDGRNMIDILRSGLFITYTICLWIGVSFGHEYLMVLAVLFISLARGIAYFRAFKQTRYLINLISEVLLDCIPFLVLFIYTTISSGFLLYALTLDKEGESHLLESMGSSYVLNLGDFSVDNYGALEWGVFLLATFINPILMLNLLISIMGDTCLLYTSDAADE